MFIVLIDLDLNSSLFFFFFFMEKKNLVQFLACGTGSVGTVGNVG